MNDGTSDQTLRDFLLAAIDADERRARGALMPLDRPRWYEAPLPPRSHRCETWEQGYVNDFTLVERCRCGGVRLDRIDPWIERNSRRRP